MQDPREAAKAAILNEISELMDSLMGDKLGSKFGPAKGPLEGSPEEEKSEDPKMEALEDGTHSMPDGSRMSDSEMSPEDEDALKALYSKLK